MIQYIIFFILILIYCITSYNLDNNKNSIDDSPIINFIKNSGSVNINDIIDKVEQAKKYYNL